MAEKDAAFHKLASGVGNAAADLSLAFEDSRSGIQSASAAGIWHFLDLSRCPV
jgi:beta-phosphoglucomutase-like phosphatase (HAD superfamily)